MVAKQELWRFLLAGDQWWLGGVINAGNRRLYSNYSAVSYKDVTCSSDLAGMKDQWHFSLPPSLSLSLSLSQRWWFSEFKSYDNHCILNQTLKIWQMYINACIVPKSQIKIGSRESSRWLGIIFFKIIFLFESILK